MLLNLRYSAMTMTLFFIWNKKLYLIIFHTCGFIQNSNYVWVYILIF
jgi:citrate lyase synthetase